MDFWDARGLGLLFVVCACAVGLRGNRLTGMRGTWGVVWRSAHVPTIPFTWLRRANAWVPTAHASNYQALLSIKLCEQCGSNSCVRVFFIPMGSRGQKQWVVTSISHMGEMRDSDWSRPNLLRCDWLPIIVAIMTTQLTWSKQKLVFNYQTSGNFSSLRFFFGNFRDPPIVLKNSTTLGQIWFQVISCM